MKFELTEPNKQFSDSELIKDLKYVSNLIEKVSVTLREYQKHGNYSYQTLKKRFGSWDGALKAANLEKSKRPWGGDLSETRIPEENLLDDMQRVAQELYKKSITIADYDEIGKYGSATICKRFGGWNKAKDAANLKIGRVYNSTEYDYFENILSVWQTLGRQPKYQEMVAPLSKLHISSYERKFGTWRVALKKFIQYVNTKDTFEKEIDTKDQTIQKKVDSPEPRKKKRENGPKRTNRNANLRQRYCVLKRDGFKCVLCGDSPANNYKCVLHIDHILPWSHGGETVEENLRTLCLKCNLGRSNKE